jgi:preprotein translocase subunit YajC
VTASDLGALLPLVLLGVLLLVLFRTNRGRLRAAQELQQKLAPGQEIMTTAGLYGTVVEVRDDVLVLEAAPGVMVRWARPAVAKIVTQGAGGSTGVDLGKGTDG